MVSFFLPFAGSGLTRHQKVNFSTFDGKLESHFITKWSQNIPYGPCPWRRSPMCFCVFLLCGVCVLVPGTTAYSAIQTYPKTFGNCSKYLETICDDRLLRFCKIHIDYSHLIAIFAMETRAKTNKSVGSYTFRSYIYIFINMIVGLVFKYRGIIPDV